jgi:hypothetical protein
MGLVLPDTSFKLYQRRIKISNFTPLTTKIQNKLHFFTLCHHQSVLCALHRRRSFDNADLQQLHAKYIAYNHTMTFVTVLRSVFTLHRQGDSTLTVNKLTDGLEVVVSVSRQ